MKQIIEQLNDQALDLALAQAGEDSQHLLSIQTELFDDLFCDFLVEEVLSTGVQAEEVVQRLREHNHQRLSEIIGESYIEDWYDNFIENFSEEAA